MSGKAAMFSGPVIFCFVLDKYVVSIGDSDAEFQVGEPEEPRNASGQSSGQLGMQPNQNRKAAGFQLRSVCTQPPHNSSIRDKYVHIVDRSNRAGWAISRA